MATETFGERIRRKRTEQKIGLRQAAGKVDISPTFLSRVETNVEKAIPGEKVIKKLADILDDDFDELMALAGRVSVEVSDFVKSDPGMPEFLRQAQERNISADKLMKLLDKVKDED